MKHLYLTTVIGHIRSRLRRRSSSLGLAAAILGIGASALAQTSDIRQFGAH